LESKAWVRAIPNTTLAFCKHRRNIRKKYWLPLSFIFHLKLLCC